MQSIRKIEVFPAVLAVLGAFWILVALLTWRELATHYLANSADARSQVLRLLEGLLAAMSGVSLLYRQFGWRVFGSIGPLVEGFRNYAILVVPPNLVWVFGTLFSASIVVVAIFSILASLGVFRVLE